jgi:steroid delta-isomerase
MQGLVDSKIVAAVDEYFSSIRDRDERRWLATFAEDAAVHDPVGTIAAEGREGLREAWRVLSTPFERLIIAEQAAFYASSGAAVHWAARGTGTNQREVSFEGITVFEFTPDAKIQTLMAYWDPAAMMIELAG